MKNWIYSTGKKKSAVAKIFLSPKTGNIIINNKKLKDYFPKNFHYKLTMLALELTKTKFYIKIKVKGGGVMSQIHAIKLGIAKAVFIYNNDCKYLFKNHKLLSSESKRVERKKLGRRKARKNKQFSKR